MSRRSSLSRHRWWAALGAGVIVLGAVALASSDRRGGSSGAPGDVRVSLSSGGRDRSYVVHTPPGFEEASGAPLVLVLHGGGGDADNAMEMSGMSDKADEEDFVVAYPEGTARRGRLRTWNAGSCCGYAQREDVDDVAFVLDVIGAMTDDYGIDPDRVYVIGMSNGAMMAQRIGCELDELVAGIGSVAGALNVPCSPGGPVSVVMVHGTADDSVPYAGGDGADTLVDTGEHASVADGVGFWSDNAGCSATSEDRLGDHIVRESHTGCRDGTLVELYTVEGGGHAWPGGEKGRRQGDEPTHELSATDVFWEAMEDRPKA